MPSNARFIVKRASYRKPFPPLGYRMDQSATSPRLEELLNQFGKSIGLDNLSLEQDETSLLVFDDKVVVNFRYDADHDSLLIFSPVGMLPAQNRAEICEYLLQANLFWTGTGGGTLAVDAATDEVILAYRTPVANLDSVSLERLVDSFVTGAEAWIAILHGQVDVADVELPTVPGFAMRV